MNKLEAALTNAITQPTTTTKAALVDKLLNMDNQFGVYEPIALQVIVWLSDCQCIRTLHDDDTDRGGWAVDEADSWEWVLESARALNVER